MVTGQRLAWTLHTDARATDNVSRRDWGLVMYVTTTRCAASTSRPGACGLTPTLSVRMAKLAIELTHGRFEVRIHWWQWLQVLDFHTLLAF